MFISILSVNGCDAVVVDDDISCPATNYAAGLFCPLMAFAGRVDHDVADHVTDVFEVKGHNGMTPAPALRLVVMNEPPVLHWASCSRPIRAKALRFPDGLLRR